MSPLLGEHNLEGKRETKFDKDLVSVSREIQVYNTQSKSNYSRCQARKQSAIVKC